MALLVIRLFFPKAVRIRLTPEHAAHLDERNANTGQILTEFYIKKPLEIPSYLLCDIGNGHVLDFRHSLNNRADE